MVVCSTFIGSAPSFTTCYIGHCSWPCYVSGMIRSRLTPIFCNSAHISSFGIFCIHSSCSWPHGSNRIPILVLHSVMVAISLNFFASSYDATVHYIVPRSSSGIALYSLSTLASSLAFMPLVSLQHHSSVLLTVTVLIGIVSACYRSLLLLLLRFSSRGHCFPADFFFVVCLCCLAVAFTSGPSCSLAAASSSACAAASVCPASASAFVGFTSCRCHYFGQLLDQSLGS